MKKRIFVWLAVGLLAMGCMEVSAMSLSKVRRHTRFLTDRMAYELNLSPVQYDDIYEINFDFIYNVESIMDDVLMGYDWALDDYYRMLDVRNDDLRWVLSASQYGRFLGMDYFYRPIYASGRTWNFRVYVVYNNPNYFYFGKPRHYRTYSGGHYRTHYNNRSYYSNRYHHDIYKGNFSTRRENIYMNNRREDFGVTTRPSNSSRPTTSPVRPSTSTARPATTPSRPSSNTSRPSSSNKKDEVYDTGRSNSTRPSNSSGTSVRTGTGNTGSSSRPSSSSSGSSSARPSSTSGTSRTSTARPSTSVKENSGGTSRSSSASRPSSVRSNTSNTSRSSSATRSSSSSSGSSSRNSSGSGRGSSQGGRR